MSSHIRDLQESIGMAWPVYSGQKYKHFEDPKPGYVADWADLPEWQQETDADMFDHIEHTV